ncbi:MAG: preprotein translocase subunit YajC [Candidatus Rokubacteria bacterium]|nr:preprotein translocase subunit YajC [Candidatus Rokubacteria bacterium]
MIDLAYAMGPLPQGGSGPASMLIQLVPLIAIFAIFFFLLIRPQQRDRKRREAMLASLKKGDRVVTSGGLIGTVVGLNEQTVMLKIADSVRVECLRSAVSGLRGDAKAEQESA